MARSHAAFGQSAPCASSSASAGRSAKRSQLCVVLAHVGSSAGDRLSPSTSVPLCGIRARCSNPTPCAAFYRAHARDGEWMRVWDDPRLAGSPYKPRTTSRVRAASAYGGRGRKRVRWAGPQARTVGGNGRSVVPCVRRSRMDVASYLVYDVRERKASHGSRWRGSP